MLDIAHPKRGDTLQLPLMADFSTDGTPDAGEPTQPSLFDEAANSGRLRKDSQLSASTSGSATSSPLEVAQPRMSSH